MNGCQEIRDLILTDYIDGETSHETKSRIETHLQTCSACQAFAREVKANLVVPFEQAKPQAVPSHLWDSIKEKITEEQYVPSASFWERFLDAFSPRLAPVLASFAVLMLVGSFVLNNHQIKQVKDQEQGEYLASLLNSGEDVSSGTQTSIEKYFL